MRQALTHLQIDIDIGINMSIDTGIDMDITRYIRYALHVLI